MAQPAYLTNAGLNKLKSELEELSTIRRQGVAERIQKAKEIGGTVDNAEYDEAKNEQAFIEGRILTLDNLINNAVKFTPQRGRVEIKAEKSGESHFKLSVADTGPGIAPEDHEKIFEKFLQLDGSMTREHAGAGLGLAIVERIMQAHNGFVVMQSEVGKGTEFTLFFPLAQ